MNNKHKNKPSALSIFLHVVLAHVLAIAVLFVISLMIDFPSSFRQIIYYSLISTIVIKVSVIKLRHFFCSDYLHVVLDIILFLATMYLSYTIYDFTSTTIAKVYEVSNVQEAIEKGYKNFSTSFPITIDAKNRGVFYTYEVHKGRGSSTVYYAYCVYAIEGEKDAYIGETHEKRYRGVQNYDYKEVFPDICNSQYRTPKISLNSYLKRERNKSFELALLFNDDTGKIEPSKVSFFTIHDNEEKEQNAKDFYSSLTILFCIIYPVIGVIFFFNRNKLKVVDIEDVTFLLIPLFLLYGFKVLFSKRDYYGSALLIACIIACFYIGLLCGYDDSNRTVLFRQLIELGSATNYLCYENGEIWRLVTALFVHYNDFHLLLDVVAFALFFLYVVLLKYDAPVFFNSPKIIALFFICGIMSNVLTILTSKWLCLGALGGIAGIYGFRFAFSNLIKWRITKQVNIEGDRNKKKWSNGKRFSEINKRLGKNGIPSTTSWYFDFGIIGFALLFSLSWGISPFQSLFGFIIGCIIGIVYFFNSHLGEGQ